MSFGNIFAQQTHDHGLDDVFKSSAGPSTAPKPFPSITAQGFAPVPSFQGKKERKTGVSVEAHSDSYTRKKRKRTELEVQPQPRNASVSEHERNTVGSLSTDEPPDVSSDDELPQHETLTRTQNKRKRIASTKVKYTPEDETPEVRDARTIFLGNLPVVIVKSKPLQKQLRRHVLSVVPAAKIESVRFRSVAFLNPTTKLEEEGGEGQSKSKGRQQKRAAEWKEQHQQDASLPQGSKRDQQEAAENKKGEKQYMAPAEKRRLAAIRGEVHNEAVATTNAYIVFAYTKSEEDGESESTPGEKGMDPFTAAQDAAKKLNGSVFAEHTIRADKVGGGQSKDAHGSAIDPKLSIFVGNLDFASSEDDLRAFFESVIKEERGLRANKKVPLSAKSDTNPEHRGDTWVSRVRIIRDNETQLGKGFAYVQFADRDCVDIFLSLDSERLAFAKRTLRVQRCKVVTNRAKSSATKPQVTPKGATTSKGSGAAKDTVIPQGDPLLGSRLAGLSKDERRAAKAQDADRVARRLAKKKARNAMQKAESVTAGSKSGRKRVRDKKTSKVNPGRKEGKRRVRSDRSVHRRNIKK